MAHIKQIARQIDTLEECVNEMMSPENFTEETV